VGGRSSATTVKDLVNGGATSLQSCAERPVLEEDHQRPRPAWKIAIGPNGPATVAARNPRCSSGLPAAWPVGAGRRRSRG
jgi:hypothetical protein